MDHGWFNLFNVLQKWLVLVLSGINWWFLSMVQWIGLRENLQETIDFPIKYGDPPLMDGSNGFTFRGPYGPIPSMYGVYTYEYLHGCEFGG